MSDPRFEVRPMIAWSGPVTPHSRRRSARAFKASWTDTIELLKKEVKHLGGKVIAVQVDATSDEIRLDGMLRARARVGSPGVKIAFNSKYGPLTYATDVYDHWQANVRAIALALEALRAVDRYGVSRSGEQYRGWSAITSAAAETALTDDEARRVLADASGIPPADLVAVDAINRAFKIASRKAHPDTGGNADAFRLVSAARDVLLAAAGQSGGAR